jgi:hypothetical protein
VNLRKEGDSFYRQHDGYFTDDTAAAGLATASRPFTRFGVGFADFDNDGYMDLYEASGRVERSEPLYATDPYAEPNLLFRGGVNGRFTEVQPRGGTREPLIAASRAAAFGDVDDDGGIDILVANRDAPAYLLRNIVPRRGHWIMFRVIEEPGRDAENAVVMLNIGGRRVWREVRTAYSYFAANDPRVHVGLGAETVALKVVVRWVDGQMESFGDFPADDIHTLRRGAGVGP